MLGETRESAVELGVVRAIILHGAAGLVSDGDHAIDVGIAFQQVEDTDFVGDVFAGACRAIDSTDDSNAVAGAITAAAAVVAVEVACGGPRRTWRRIAAKGIVAFEQI